MRKKTLASAGALASAVVMVAAGTAFASNTLTVGGSATPAGNVGVTGANNGNLTFLTDFGVPTTCTASSTGGYVTRGASVTAGSKIGAITSLTFSSCTATDLRYPVNITKKSSPTEWPIHVVTTPTSKSQDVIQIEIRNVSAHMRSTGSAPYACAANAAGTVRGTFTRSTQRLAISTSGYPLALDALNTSATKESEGGAAASSSCAGEIQDGDGANMTGSFTLSTGGAGVIGMS